MCRLRRGGGRTAMGPRKVVIAGEQANIKEADIWRDWHWDKQCLTRRRRCAYHRLTLERLVGRHNSKTLLLTTSISTVRGCVYNLLIPPGMMALKPAAESFNHPDRVSRRNLQTGTQTIRPQFTLADKSASKNGAAVTLMWYNLKPEKTLWFPGCTDGKWE